jgi:hypothetical protein
MRACQRCAGQGEARHGQSLTRPIIFILHLSAACGCHGEERRDEAISGAGHTRDIAIGLAMTQE